MNRIVLLFLFISLSIFGQDKYLSEESLRNLNNNYVYEGQCIGGLKSGEPYYNYFIENLRYDYVIKDKEHFLNVLKDSIKENQVIYIPGKLEIDLSGEKKIVIRRNVSIVSDRGKEGSHGARLFTTDSGVFPLFRVSDNVKISGVRIEGGDKDIFFNNIQFFGVDADRKNKYENAVSAGVHVEGSNFNLINCELFGWTHTAIHIKKKSKNNIFKYNYFHHNQRYGLGYGITVDGGEALVIANYFDYNRHDIAGTGIEGSGYEVYLNVFLSNTHSDSIDMHGGYDRKDGTNIAGDYMYVYNNYFERVNGQRKAAWLRGIPIKESFFENNYVLLLGSDLNNKRKNSNQFEQVNHYGNIVFKQNYIVNDKRK